MILKSAYTGEPLVNYPWNDALYKVKELLK